MDRRGFLRNASLLAAGAAILGRVELSPTAPKPSAWTLYGDGETDDTDALQALFDGHEVLDRAGVVQVSGPGYLVVENGRFRVCRTVEIGGTHRPRASVTGCFFDGRDIPDGSPVVHLHSDGPQWAFNYNAAVCAPFPVVVDPLRWRGEFALAV